ncbi:hypothetical protein GH714_030412 [Hevea brasiliensis]|uniref:Uncharacterized protein n=1 Tax=Hevea brasiliensis TaxID=3981 RepID=A0A6A6K9V6_HEVBR|nr:hypothetical protein GH714_030412 [Hevea brasiliensis]
MNISSRVPELLTKFSHLESLRLNDCGLQGEFPVGIYQLPNLKMLDLNHNRDLKGQIPYSFSNPSKLVHLDLSFNHFSFHNPSISSFSWVGNLTKITTLGLAGFNLKGPEFREITAAIIARETSITFEELHDKLTDYDAFLERESYTDGLSVTANYTRRNNQSKDFSNHQIPGNSNKKQNKNGYSHIAHVGIRIAHIDLEMVILIPIIRFNANFVIVTAILLKLVSRENQAPIQILWPMCPLHHP